MSHSVATLKQMISAYNIKGYSKMKKPELVDLMTSKEHINKFRNIKAKGGMPTKASSAKRPPPPPKTPPPKKGKPESGNKFNMNTLLARDKLLKKIRRGATREKGQLKRLDALTKKNEPKKKKKASKEEVIQERQQLIKKHNEKKGNTPQYQKLLDRAKKRKKAKN